MAKVRSVQQRWTSVAKYRTYIETISINRGRVFPIIEHGFAVNDTYFLTGMM